jgi:hypothetical protein
MPVICLVNAENAVRHGRRATSSIAGGTQTNLPQLLLRHSTVLVWLIHLTTNSQNNQSRSTGAVGQTKATGPKSVLAAYNLARSIVFGSPQALKRSW